MIFLLSSAHNSQTKWTAKSCGPFSREGGLFIMTMLSEKELCCCRASELQLHPTNPPQRKEGKLENPMIQKKTGNEHSSYITAGLQGSHPC